MLSSAVGFWLAKSEPASFSWADLLASHAQTTPWDGVRNYQARNFLRDGCKVGDRVFFYQSSCSQLGIVGVMRVVRAAYPDPSQYRPDSPHFDEKSTRKHPRWVAVDMQAEASFARTVTRAELQQEPSWARLPLFARHSRLSFQPIPPQAAQQLLLLAGRLLPLP